MEGTQYRGKPSRNSKNRKQAEKAENQSDRWTIKPNKQKGFWSRQVKANAIADQTIAEN